MAFCIVTIGAQTADAQPYGISLGSGFSRTNTGPTSGPLSTSSFMEEFERRLQDARNDVPDKVTEQINNDINSLFEDCKSRIGGGLAAALNSANFGASLDGNGVSGFMDWNVYTYETPGGRRFDCVAGVRASSVLFGPSSPGTGQGSLDLDVYGGVRGYIDSSNDYFIQTDINLDLSTGEAGANFSFGVLF